MQFSEDGVRGAVDAELGPETCVALGLACASLRKNIKLGIATDGTRTAKALKMALCAGAMAGGAHIWDFLESFAAQLPFFTSFCGLDMGIFIESEAENSARISFCASDGLPLLRTTEQEIENRVYRAEYFRADISKGRDISNITSIRMIYSQELNRASHGLLKGLGVAIESTNSEIARVLRESLDRLYCEYSAKLIFHISPDGYRLTATDEYGNEVDMHRIVAIICNHEFRDDKDVALPADAPRVIDEIAGKYGRKVLRYYDSSYREENENARRLAACQNWSKDALFMSIKLLSVMRDENKNLSELSAEIPKFFVMEKSVTTALPFANLSMRLLKALKNELFDVAFSQEGAVVKSGDCKAVIRPSKVGNDVLVHTESRGPQAALEFSENLSKRLREISSIEGLST